MDGSRRRRSAAVTGSAEKTWSTTEPHVRHEGMREMDASEAMSVLQRAGRGAEAREVVDQLAKSAHAAYEQINSDDTRTADYKREALTRHYAGVRDEAARTLSRLAESAQAAERRDAARVFGTDGLAGDAASLMISRRDAADRVASATNSSQLRELLI